MAVAISVLCNDRAYYYEARDNSTVLVSKNSAADIVISDLNFELAILVNKYEAIIRYSNDKEIKAPFDKFVILDNDSQLAVYLSETNIEEKTVRLPETGEWLLGRSSKLVSNNPVNQIVVGLPFVSSTHCKFVRENGITSLIDSGSKNGLFVNGKRVSQAKLCDGDVVSIFTVQITLRGDNLVFRNVGSLFKVEELESRVIKKGEKATTQTDIVQIKRSPRIMHEMPSGTIEISAPPAAGSKPEINWLATFLPTAITLGIAILMTTILGNPMMLLYTLPMTIGGVIVSVTNYRRQNQKYNEKIDVRQRKYEHHISDVVKDIEKKRKDQLSAMELSDPATTECFEIVRSRKARLWHRTPTDQDFVSVRIGHGIVDFAVKIEIPKESLTLEDDALKAKPAEIQKKYATIDDAPITCNILEEQICGIVGAHRDTTGIIKNIIAQLVTHHCYTEVKLVYVYNSHDDAEMSWVKDIPHCYSSDRKHCFVATSKEEARDLFQHLSAVFKQRKADSLANTSYGRAPVFLPYYLVVIQEPAYLEKSDPINEYLFMTRNLGIGCLMAVQEVSQLPKECHELITIKNGEGYIFNSDRATQKQMFKVDNVSGFAFDELGRLMKPLYCEEGIVKETLPQSYSFFEMLGVSRAGDIDLRKRWGGSDVSKSLAAPIGIAENGATIFLDLHESAHGPHGLVAGTTGSGKSELLQSYILSVAATYHPYEVSFVIIDFKGGGMASQVAGLPHLIGTITNIDGQELNRSLLSIEAELLRRQKIIREYNDSHSDKVKDIYDYIDRYKTGRAEIPLPHLVIIVDEFAELKAEQPEFMKKLISAARIGRSLGVHLILATQKPAGQVDDQIWSNTKFQMCLKVASPADSKEVIKSELAASIINPGRAYLRVGNNEVFILLQSGYSGEKVASPSGEKVTQMQETIKLIESYCEANGIKKLPDICLPSLEKMIAYPNEDTAVQGNAIPIGFYDDPANQYQGQFALDVFEKNALIVGTSRTGKTNLLQTLIRGISSRYSPSEVNIYIIDFASMILKNLESLNHVGGVIMPSEDEKFKNLIKLLYNEIEIRKKKFFAVGVSSYSSYLESGKTDIARIVLFIDNFTALREMYLIDNDPIQAICQNGITYGISVVMANSQTVGITQYYMSAFSTRIALFCNNSTEYHSLFEKCSLKLNDIPGRSIVEKDGALFLCQLYKAFSGEKEIEQAKAIREYISLQNSANPTMKAKEIPVIPEVLHATDALAIDGDAAEESATIVAGLEYETVSPTYIDLKNIGVLMLSGRPHFGRSNFLRYLISAVAKKHPGAAEFFVIDGINRKLGNLKDNASVKKYVFLPDQASEIIEHIESVVVSRYQEVIAGNIDVLTNAPVLVLMINNLDAIEAISNNSTLMAKYNNIIGKYKNMNVCVILGAVENANIPYSAPEVLKKAKDERKLLFFDDLDNLKLFDLPYSATKKHKKALKLGDCYFVKGNDCVKLKTPKC